jgi:hypothetical protein
VDPELLEAYRRTEFQVDLPDGECATIRIGQRCPEVDALLATRGSSTWAYITAHNPGSVALSASENAGRHSRLVERLRRDGYMMLAGQGVGETGTWEPEVSLLIVGIPRDVAEGIASDFGQIAFVWGERNGGAELVFPGHRHDV